MPESTLEQNTPLVSSATYAFTMNPSPTCTLEIVGGVLAVATVVAVGRRPLQLATAVGSCVFLALRLGVNDLGAGNQALVSATSVTALLLMLFATWNLLQRPGERWAFRVVIYSFYAAALAGICAYGEMGAARNLEWPRDWIVIGGTYIISSTIIALTKPWFARRMLGRGNRLN